MKIFNEIDSVKIKKPVLTIGFFDGVHNGHRLLLNKLREKAEEINGTPIVFTLWPHPRIVLGKDPEQLKLLNTLEEKQYHLEKQDVENLVVFPFTIDFSKYTAFEFMKSFLKEKLNVHTLLVGYNHKFGNDGVGDMKTLQEYGKQLGINIERAEEYHFKGFKTSSSSIREALLKGKMNAANDMLGYAYSFKGTVIHGNQLGRKIDFPTANLQLTDSIKLLPGDGVYAVKVLLKGKKYKGMLNIGFRPSVSNGEPSKQIEVNIFNFAGDIYDEELTVKVISRLRDEQKFESVDALKAQLEKDKKAALEILAERK